MLKWIRKILPKKHLKLQDVFVLVDKGDYIEITAKKDLAINIQGHLLTIVEGLNVTLAKEIHLNPSIDKSMKNLDKNIIEAKRLKLENN